MSLMIYPLNDDKVRESIARAMPYPDEPAERNAFLDGVQALAEAIFRCDGYRDDATDKALDFVDDCVDRERAILQQEKEA
jgi:hypothetical protein